MRGFVSKRFRCQVGGDFALRSQRGPQPHRCVCLPVSNLRMFFCSDFVPLPLRIHVGSVQAKSGPAIHFGRCKQETSSVRTLLWTISLLFPANSQCRRKATQIKRLFRCFVGDCSRSYGTEGALKMHLKLKHPDVTYDPMNPPVVIEVLSSDSKKRQRPEEDQPDDDSASSSIDDLNPSPPPTPGPASVSSAPQSPSGYDLKPHKPAPLPQLNSIFTSNAYGYPPMMPAMYPMPHGGFPTWSAPISVAPMSVAMPPFFPEPAQQVDNAPLPRAKRLKTEEVDVLSTLVNLKSKN